MNRSRKMLVGMVTLLSLLGVGGAAQASIAASSGTVTASRWCC